MAWLNFWPFNRPEPRSFDEFVATLDPAPCGKQREHYHWEISAGMPCPICTGIKRRKREMEAEDRMADKVAERIARRLKESS